jgi:hypothetical protein
MAGMVRVGFSLAAILASGTLAAAADAGARTEAQASESPRFAVSLRAVLSGSTTFQEERRFTTPYDTPAPFDEHGRFSARYDFGSSLGADAGVRVRLYRRIAIRIDYTTVSRDGLTDVDLRVPHPFHPDRMRVARGSDDAFVISESAVHADMALLFGLGRLKGALLAGASYFRVKADLVDDIEYRYVYPYESGDLTVASLRRNPASDAPLGFNCGLNVDLPFGRLLSVGFLVRYSRARARFAPEPGTEVIIDVGGPQASAGVSLYF